MSYSGGDDERDDNGVSEHKKWDDEKKHSFEARRESMEKARHSIERLMMKLLFHPNTKPMSDFDDAIEFMKNPETSDVVSEPSFSRSDRLFETGSYLPDTNPLYEDEGHKVTWGWTESDKEKRTPDQFVCVEKGHTNQVISVVDNRARIIAFKLYADIKPDEEDYERFKKFRDDLIVKNMSEKQLRPSAAFLMPRFSFKSSFQHATATDLDPHIGHEIDALLVACRNHHHHNDGGDDDVSHRHHNHSRNRYDLHLHPDAQEWNGRKIRGKYHNGQYPTQKTNNRTRNFTINQPNQSTRSNYNNRNKITFNNHNMYKPKMTKK